MSAKKLNSLVVGACQSFHLFRQISWFLQNNRALPKFRIKNQFYINHASHLKCTFHFSFCIFLGTLICSQLKISIALLALSWKCSRSLEQKFAGKKFCATFYEFRVYIFLLKVLLYLLIIFWKIPIDTLYEENGPRNIPPVGISIRKITTHQAPSLKIPPSWNFQSRKFSPGIFPPISLSFFT